jgi:hypothetical protein
MHSFEAQHAELTLAEGLAEYFAVNPGLKRPEALAPEARDFFSRHDAVHVVFGCGTSLADEAVVKLSSLLGTTGGLSVLRGYALYDSLDIYRDLSAREVLTTILRAPVIIARTAARCLRQRKRWPWADFAPLMDRRLVDLRGEYGIVTAHRQAIGPA